MSEQPVESARTRGKIVVKPIVFGNESKFFGKKRESDGHTHTWTIYVKPYNPVEDISQYVKKVRAGLLWIHRSLIFLISNFSLIVLTLEGKRCLP